MLAYLSRRLLVIAPTLLFVSMLIFGLQRVLKGDLGDSTRISRPVRDLVIEKLPVTGQLAAMAFLVALIIGIPMGVLSAVKKKSAWDYAANAVALWGLSTPNFWLGILLILLF